MGVYDVGQAEHIGQVKGSQALRRAQLGLRRWREERARPGVRIPEQLWALAVEAARQEGVDTAARALGVNRRRLAERAAAESEAKAQMGSAGVSEFIELNLSDFQGSSWAVLELSGADGERLKMMIKGGCNLDLAGLARAFFSRQA